MPRSELPTVAVAVAVPAIAGDGDTADSRGPGGWESRPPAGPGGPASEAGAADWDGPWARRRRLPPSPDLIHQGLRPGHSISSLRDHGARPESSPYPRGPD